MYDDIYRLNGILIVLAIPLTLHVYTIMSYYRSRVFTDSSYVYYYAHLTIYIKSHRGLQQ